MTDQSDSLRVVEPPPLPTFQKSEADQPTKNQWDFASVIENQGATVGVVPPPPIYALNVILHGDLTPEEARAITSKLASMRGVLSASPDPINVEKLVRDRVSKMRIEMIWRLMEAVTGEKGDPEASELLRAATLADFEARS